MAMRGRNISMPEALWDKLEAEAARKERSINWLVGRIVRDHFAAVKETSKKKGG